MKIKVCGMKDAFQVKELSSMEVDFCGLIFYKGSKRYAGDESVTFKMALENIPIKKIGVFVNEQIEEVIRKISDFKLYAVQLHGDESVDYCLEVKNYVKLIKVFRLKSGIEVDKMIAPFMEAADYFLFDNGNGGYGGTGEKFEWNVLRNAIVNKPFFLSGGISHSDIDILNAFHHPYLYAVDINSRFELSPGIKDLGKIESFIKAIR